MNKLKLAASAVLASITMALIAIAPAKATTSVGVEYNRSAGNFVVNGTVLDSIDTRLTRIEPFIEQSLTNMISLKAKIELSNFKIKTQLAGYEELSQNDTSIYTTVGINLSPNIKLGIEAGTTDFKQFSSGAELKLEFPIVKNTSIIANSRYRYHFIDNSGNGNELLLSAGISQKLSKNLSAQISYRFDRFSVGYSEDIVNSVRVSAHGFGVGLKLDF